MRGLISAPPLALVVLGALILLATGVMYRGFWRIRDAMNLLGPAAVDAFTQRWESLI